MNTHFKYKTSAIVISLIGVCHSALAEETERELSEVNVVGRSEGQSYYRSDARVLRSDTPLREIPQAVRVIPRQAIDDIGAVRIEEAYDYVSGINRQNSWGGLRDNFSIRGFAGNPNTANTNFLRNGFSDNRGHNASRDMANIERLEVIKGPASALYGSSEPGGILNIVTKKPQFKPGHAIGFYAGSYDTYRTTLDSTGPISETFAYRINVAAEDKGGFRDYIGSKRIMVAPSFTWLPTPNTIVNYEFEFLRQKAPMDRGIAAINGKVDSLPRERFLGEPNDGDITITNNTHQLSMEHEFSPDWKGKASLAYRTTNLDGYSSETSPRSAGRIRWTTAGAPFIERERRQRDFSSDDIAFQGEIHGKFVTGPIAHEVMAGFDSYRFELRQVMKRGRSTSSYGLNVYNPVYGQTLAANTTPHNSKERQYNTALFLQDQLSLSEHWRLLMGLRHDRYRQNVDDRNNGTHTGQEQSVTTPRLGLTWLATPTLSVYALASKSFRPNSGTDVNSRPFEPERGQSKEVGLKYESPDKRYGGTLSLFDIKKKNVLTNDPNNAGYSVTAGEVRSRGIEFDFSGQLTNKIRLLANYAYIDAKIIKDINVALQNVRLTNIPKHGGSLLAMYEDGFNGSRYGVGAGVNYVGKRAGNSIDTFKLPGYTTVRTMAYWKPNPTLRFSLDIDNLFDKHYYASSHDVFWINPGAPRTITLGVQAKF